MIRMTNSEEASLRTDEFNPSYTIFMPFYGDSNYFRLAVESVRAQHNPHWNLVIIDDANPDRSPGDWAKSLNDSRITYIRNATNIGVSATFNKCLDLAKSTHLTLMGCDDVLRPNFVDQALNLIGANPTAAIIQPGVAIVDASGSIYSPLPDRIKKLLRPKPSTKMLSGEALATSLMRGNWLYFPSLIWNAESLQHRRFSDQFSVTQDLDLYLSLICDGETLALGSEVAFFYRRHRTSVSSAQGPNGARYEEELALYEKYFEIFRDLGWSSAANAARTHWSSRFAALLEIPRALGVKKRPALRSLVKHAFRIRL